MTPNNFRVKSGLTVGTTITGGNTSITGFVNATSTVNAAGLAVGTSFVANSTGAYHTGTVNAASYTVGTSFTANATLVNAAAINVTGQINVATFYATGSANIASVVQANSTGLWTTGTVNAATVSVGTALIANTTRVVIGTSTGLQANGGIGSAGQVLHSNGTTVYWAADDGITSIATANGLSGGPITSAGTIGVTTGPTLTVNSTGIHVNSALSITDLTLAGNLTVSGTRTYVNTTTLDVGDNIITLNADLGAVAPTQDAGIEIMRGTSANVQFMWDETNDRWSTNGQPLAISSLITSTNTATFGTAAYIVANGNIGAGTAAPSNQFSVGGNSLATISFDWTGDNAAKAWISANYSSGEVRYAAVTNYFPAFYSNNNERMRIDLSGSVLINRTGASGLGKLNCEGGADFTGGNVYLGRDTGNVAIGTTTATSKLYIKSAGSNIIAAELAGNANTIFKVYESAGDGYLEVLSGASSPVSKLSGYTGTPTYFLSNTGIGNTAPTDKLSVNGTTYLQGVTTLAANLVMANNNITGPVLTGYTEAEVANTAATGTWTMDCGAANFFDLTLTGNITISPTNVPPNTRVWSGTIVAKQDATGGRTITWPSGIKWPGGSAPPATTTANAIDIWSLMTYDGGTTWIGSLTVKNVA